jgi:hypothetical protein
LIDCLCIGAEEIIPKQVKPLSPTMMALERMFEGMQQRYISVNSFTSSSGVVLLNCATEVLVDYEALFGMSNQCLVLIRLLSSTEIDIVPWPPPEQCKLQDDDVHLRLTPWSSYSINALLLQWEVLSRGWSLVSEYMVKPSFEGIGGGGSYCLDGYTSLDYLVLDKGVTLWVPEKKRNETNLAFGENVLQLSQWEAHPPCSTVFLSNSVVVQFKLQVNGVHLRPTLWASFSRDIMLVGRSVATLIAFNFGWYSQFWLDFWNTSLPVPILIHVQAQCCLQEPVKWMFFWMSQPVAEPELRGRRGHITN